jgi:precorrin-8X/cobalt-precorrin-8 methylmutase
MDYLRSPDDIYAQSFATIRREAGLGRFCSDEQDVATRLIHACGMIDIADDLIFSKGAVAAGRKALAASAPIICDVRMVAEGIIGRNLSAGNKILCNVATDEAREHAITHATTRSAAGIEVLQPFMAGSVVAIGNAPTALFHLLERMDENFPKPALILGFPVGFVGAVESKAELAANARGVPFITLVGRRGGSALAAAAVNALAVGLGT